MSFHDNEKQLLFRIAEGDEASFAQLFHHYLSRLKPFAEKLCTSHSESREIIQETFIQLWLNRDKLPKVNNLSSYIFRIAANQYHMTLRRSLSQQRTLRHYHLQFNQQYKDVLGQSVNITEHGIRLKELQQLICEATRQLPPKRRQIFQMSRNQGMSIREIAETLSLSPKTVKNSLFAALGSIRDYLKKAGGLGYFLFIYLLSR